MDTPTYKGFHWDRFPPERRGRWGRFLYVMRWEHGKDDPITGNRIPLTQEAVFAKVAALGRKINPTSYSQMESGRHDVNEEWAGVFERLWNATPDPDAAASVAPTATGDVATLLRAIEAQRGYIETLTGAIDKQRQDIAALMDLVTSLLPRPAAGVMPPVSTGAPPSPNEQAVIERTLDVTGLPLIESTAAVPSDRPVAPTPPAGPRGSSRP